jgi:ABC-type antimicrobial peptide transport system permease subunit
MGLYSVLALTMRSRTREIGIRIAIGARPDLIARQFLSQALALGAAGIGVGTGAAWAATRLIGSWLYGVDAHDAASYAGATVVVVAAVLAAGYLPARRAAQVDPLSALRVE